MRYRNIETGCWQFVGDDGENYEIIGEKARELCIEGLRVRIVVQPLSGRMASTCMVGTLVELVRINNISKE